MCRKPKLLPFYVLVKLKLQHPPRTTPRAFELLKIGLFKFPPSGQKSRSNAPPIRTEMPLLKDKFRLQSNTVHAFQREICRIDTFKLLLKTVLRALFTDKGEILSWKSFKPCKNWKNSRAYYARTRDKSGSNSPPFQGNVQISPFPGTMHSQMPGVCPGGMLKLQFDRYIMKRNVRGKDGLVYLILGYASPSPSSSPLPPLKKN